MRCLLPFCAALLSACAALPPPAAPVSMVAEGSFALEGRLSLRQGETRHHVGISWRHEAAGDEIFLTGPLGQGIAQLTRDADGARLLTADRQAVTAPDWEGLAERAFGMRLPLAKLPRLLDSPPGITRRDVDGWRVDYLDFDQGRPALIELRRDDIEVRFKIDNWTR